MKKVDCNCKKGKAAKKTYRSEYGTNSCDSYSLHFTLGIVIANYLYQYIADAKERIVRDDWKTIEKHADAIMAYSEADSWDLYGDDTTLKIAFLEKEKAWREAMFWLTESWQSLWW